MLISDYDYNLPEELIARYPAGARRDSRLLVVDERFLDLGFADLPSQLRPGDLILTYTAGYISDVFIPGAFKHGITYVGSPQQREQAGLEANALPAMAPDARGQLAAHALNQFMQPLEYSLCSQSVKRSC